MRYKLELIAVIAITVFIALFLVQNAYLQSTLPPDEEVWTGADNEALQLIESSGYEPWFTPLWEPPSGEIESLLFSIQAAVGALVIGYFFGYYRGRKESMRSP